MSKIGDVIVKMLLKSDDYEKGLARSKKSTQSFAKTITKGFTAAIGQVTALIAAIAGIAKALNKVSKANQTFGDKWASFTTGLKGAWDEFARSVASMDFSHLFSRLHEASQAARELYDAVDGMGEIMTAYNISSAKQAKHLAQLRVEMNNQNLSLDERIAKAKEYLRISKQLESMPLRGLSRVSDATITKTMTQMGYRFEGLTKKQIESAKKSFVQFFEWLGTEAGEKAYKKINAAYDGGKGVASGKYARTFQAMDYRGEAPGGQQWLIWLKEYAEKVSDEDRKALEDAIVQFYQADAAFDESTRRVQSLLNTLEYNRDHPSGKGGGESKASKARDIKAEAAAMRAAFEELGKLPDLPAIVGKVSYEMPDIISDEWLRRQQEQADKMKAWLDELKAKCEDAAYDITNAVQSGIVNSIDVLAEAIGSGEDIDGGAVVKALLSPLADACISAGILIMTTGKAVEALRDSLLSGLVTGGISAIAAGAALIAVGAAAKIGLAAIGSGQSSGSATSTAATPSTGGNSTQTIQSELTINVKGTLKGSDIVISGQRTVNSWNR